tara:strand:- start:411 stop:545 length:135 start_codon:yes stop_codon:yes gene_type:complete
MGGTIDGRQGDDFLLALLFIISDDQIGELRSKLDVPVTATFRAE